MEFLPLKQLFLVERVSKKWQKCVIIQRIQHLDVRLPILSRFQLNNLNELTIRGSKQYDSLIIEKT